MGNISKIVLFLTLLPTLGHSAVGNVCYVRQNHYVIYQVMKYPKTIGSKCFITNGSFVPVYEGVVGTCAGAIDCSNVGNTRVK